MREAFRLQRHLGGGARTLRSGLVLALGLALVGLGGPIAAVARDVLEVEAVGAVGLRPDSSYPTSPRDAAVRKGLLEAVRLTAMDLLGNVQTAEPDTPLDEILGLDPFEFATRFQVVEDRGERPALFSRDPDVVTEYVVIVVVSIDRDLIRERLETAGLLFARPGGMSRVRIRLVLEGLDEYWAYEEIRTALVVDLGMRSAIPVEIEPGRLTLEVEGNRPPSELLGPLQRAVAGQMELIPLSVDSHAMSLRVEAGGRKPPGAASPGSGSIDTPSPNRY